MRTSTGRFRQFLLAGVLAAVAVVVLVALLVGGGSSKHHRQTTARAAHHAARNAALTRIRPLTTVNDITSTGNNEDPVSLTLNVYDLRRQGPFVVLDFGLVCPTPQTGCSANFMFGYAPSQGHNSDASDAEAFTSSLGSAGGISLLDPVNDVEYLSVKNTSDERPDSSEVGSLNDSYVHLEWVRFPAPPAGVQAVDVLLPNGGPVLTHIPITDGPAPTPAQIGRGTQPAARLSDVDGNPIVPSVSSTSTVGLTLPTDKLVETVGNPAGMDTETTHHSTLSLSSDVLFRFDKSNLTAAARTVLQNVASRITNGATGPVTVTGYTDSIGTDAVNIPLSQARARSVVTALKQMAAGAPVTYVAQGMGAADPVAPNTLPNGQDNPAGRRLNRRVTISYAVRTSTQPTPPPSTAVVKLPPTSPPGSTLQYRAPLGTGTDTYNVTPQGLYRDGNTLLLKLSLACVSSPQGQGCNNGDFSGSDTAPPIPFYEYGQETQSPGAELQVILTASESLSDFYLQDPTTGEILSPLHDAQYDHPISVLTPDVWPDGPTYSMWVYYPAPSTSATQMVVWLPGGAHGVTLPITAAG